VIVVYVLLFLAPIAGFIRLPDADANAALPADDDAARLQEALEELDRES